MRIFYSPKFLGISQGPGHPECPERLTAILDALEGNEVIEPKAAGENELQLVHTKEHIERVRQFSFEEANFPNNKFYKNTFDIAKLAAGAAVQAAEDCLKNGFAFALVRPPGHHAGKDFFDGFCYFNNLALAVKKSGMRTAIIDIDVHHGNGTQDIFYNDENVFYLSTHQYPLFPGTGLRSENNSHVLDIPLPPGISDGTYLQILGKALEEAKRFEPELIAISAGFDTYVDDYLANFALTDYAGIGRLISRFDCPKFACLEGGYYLPKLGENVRNFLETLI
jgi:acetoin utilization deacetylase AcuC-like enzyme